MRQTTSDSQREAARNNGAQSNGPVTPEGKARSSQNSIRHGLASKTVVLANESLADYDRLLAQYRHEWQPQGQSEIDLVVDMADARWRIRRIRAMEAAAIDSEMFIQRDAFDAAYSVTTPPMRQVDGFLTINMHNPQAIDNLGKYETRYERSYDRARRGLIQLQQLRTLQAQGTIEKSAGIANEPKPGAPSSQKPVRQPLSRVPIHRNLTLLPEEPSANEPPAQEFEWDSVFTRARQ